MTTLNLVDYMLPYQECISAADKWAAFLPYFSELKKRIPTNYIFNISKEHLDWMREVAKESQEFCATMGIYQNQVILIFYPMDEGGRRIDTKEYPYTILCELTADLKLQEVQEYTIVKNAVLSKGLQQVNRDADMAFPISNKPILEQDKALEAIEKWREEGMDWFYRECEEYRGERIFRKFYVPTADLCLSDLSLSGITCSFGLRYNDVYGRMLVTLIFISFRTDLENAERAQTVSNTYDWAKPCPPVCRIPDVTL